MSDSSASPRRQGDRIAIPGDYQHRALTQGPAIQRFWHSCKQDLVPWLFEPEPHETVLDIGCGSGIFASRLAHSGARVLGVDANADAVRYATQTFTRPNLSFQQGLLDDLHLPTCSYDKIACLEVIEHVYADQVKKLLADAYALLRPGGCLLVTTPNYRGLWPAVEWLTDHVGPTATMEEEQHVTHFHRAMLRDFLSEAGFNILSLRCFSTLAPFVAALSWSAAESLHAWEKRIDLPFGNILVAVSQKTAA